MEPIDAPLCRSLTGTEPVSKRRALAKAITLLESSRADHRARADDLLNALLPLTGKAMRLGISGVPGVGKSTFIEVLGLALISKGHRVAVLAIDPSSSISGGSILGDKTRMEQLSVNEAAYIRPSPASGTLGGVAEKTREAMLPIHRPGSQRRLPRKLAPTRTQVNCRCMIKGITITTANHREFVRVFAHFWKQITDLEPTLAAATKLPRAAPHQRLAKVDAAGDQTLTYASWQRLPAQPGQRRLRIKSVHLADATMHE